MSIPYLVAGILSISACLAHGLRFELTSQRRLQDSAIPDNIKVELRATSHLVTVALMWLGVTLLVLSLSDFVEHPGSVAKFISMHLLGFSVIWAVIVAGGRPRLLIRLPQWIVLMVIAVLTWLGA